MTSAFEPGVNVGAPPGPPSKLTKPVPWILEHAASEAKPLLGRLPIKSPQRSITENGTEAVVQKPFKPPCKTITFTGNNVWVATAFTAAKAPTALKENLNTTAGEPWVTFSVAKRSRSTAVKVEDAPSTQKGDPLLQFDDPVPPEDAEPVRRRKQSAQASSSSLDPQAGQPSASSVNLQEQNRLKAERVKSLTGESIPLPRPGNSRAQTQFDNEVNAAIQAAGGQAFPPSVAEPGRSQSAGRPQGGVFDAPGPSTLGGRPQGGFFDLPQQEEPEEGDLDPEGSNQPTATGSSNKKAVFPDSSKVLGTKI